MATETPSDAPVDGLVGKALGIIKKKGPKYSLVSVFNVVFGQSLIVGFQHIGVGKAASNALAVIISAIPAYYMSRAWVWGKRGKSELKREVLPFWIFVGIGLVLSTFLVAGVNTWWKGAHSTEMPNIITNLLNIGAFGILWVIRFFWMDRAFHLDHHHGHGPLDVLLDEDEPV